MSETTVGVFIFNTKGKLLVCHPNEVKADIWGIPKGRPEPGELIKMAGIREVNEETGIDLLPLSGKMRYVGVAKYKHKDKTLVAYTINLEEDIPISKLRCVSKFTSLYTGNLIPEIDEYKWVDFETFQHRMNESQRRLWNEYQKKLDIES